MRTSPGLMAMLDSMTGRNARIASHLDAALAARWLDEHRRAVADHSSILWTLLALELWLRGLND